VSVHAGAFFRRSAENLDIASRSQCYACTASASRVWQISSPGSVTSSAWLAVAPAQGQGCMLPCMCDVPMKSAEMFTAVLWSMVFIHPICSTPLLLLLLAAAAAADSALSRMLPGSYCRGYECFC
jgi:hypothetical protein